MGPKESEPKVGLQENPTEASGLTARGYRFWIASALSFAALLVATAGSPGAVATAEAAKNPVNPLRVLTTTREAHDLSSEQAAQYLPVYVRGVITYFDPDYGTGDAAIFIHDATGGIFVKQTAKEAEGLFVGALVEVRGVSAPGGFGSIIDKPQIKIIGRAPLPAHPRRINLAYLKTGAADAAWVEVEGSVHGVMELGHWIFLRLEISDGPLIVMMMKTPGATYSQLVDSVVRVRGNAAPSMTSDGQMIGFHLQAPNLSTLQVVEPAPRDPFAQRAIPIDELLRREYVSSSTHRIHLRGNVTLQWPGSMLCVRDAKRGICAATTEATPVAVGDLVDVAAFVETDNNGPLLTDAVFRSAGSSRLVAPQSVTPDKILGGGFGSELIQVDGLLIGYDLASSDAILQLSSGDTLFPAILPKSLAGPEVRAWKVGSRLRLTGICALGMDISSNVRGGLAVPKAFRVLLRSPSDITVVQRPSWWTPAHAILLLVLALISTLIALGWVTALRRRVALQASLLQESEQQFRHMALHDCLTGLASRVLLQNRLEIALETAKRRQMGLAVLMVDLDNFKEINDTYGHSAGDEVLKVTAQRLLRAVRKEDTVARMGGDEFVVLVQYLIDLHAAERIAAIIVGTLAAPIPIDGHEIPISASVGVCALAAEDVDGHDLLKNADAALYDAKTRGRNRFQCYEPKSARHR